MLLLLIGAVVPNALNRIAEATSEPMELSIIIINFNTLAVTSDCLNSLKKHLGTDVNHEVILIDNASKVSNEKLFKKIIPDLVYLRYETNLGFGMANNKGMEIATGDYILLLNSDTLVFDDSIQKCIHFINKPENRNVGLLGCKLLNGDGSYQPSFYPFIKNNLINYFIANNPLLNKLFSASRSFAEPFVPKRVGDVSGAFMLLRKEVYNTTGGFDPDFFLYCEETEWCRHRIQKHFEIIYFPGASVTHLGGKSAPGELMYIQSQLSLALYWYKSGLLNYGLYLSYCYLNSVFFILQYPFTTIAGRNSIKKNLGCLYRIQRYFFLDIPLNRRRYNSRKEPLILEQARNIFFKNE